MEDVDLRWGDPSEVGPPLSKAAVQRCIWTFTTYLVLVLIFGVAALVAPSGPFSFSLLNNISNRPKTRGLLGAASVT